MILNAFLNMFNGEHLFVALGYVVPVVQRQHCQSCARQENESVGCDVEKGESE